jgi:hypothetical protein
MIWKMSRDAAGTVYATVDAAGVSWAVVQSTSARLRWHVIRNGVRLTNANGKSPRSWIDAMRARLAVQTMAEGSPTSAACACGAVVRRREVFDGAGIKRGEVAEASCGCRVRQVS